MRFIDNRRRRRVNKGWNKQNTQAEAEKESPSASVPGFGRLGNRPCKQRCQ